jgi:dienelactone hydrolase
MKRAFISLVIYFIAVNVPAQDIPYYPSPGISETKLKKTRSCYELFDLKIEEIDPGTKQKLIAQAHYFKNKKTGKHPLLVMVPPIEGVSRREKSVSKHFIKQGYHVIVLEPVKNITDGTVPISEFQNTLLSFVGAVRSTVDVMVKKEEVDSNNVFVWGSSLGAIYSTIAFGADQRINSAVLIVGGGSLPDIVTESEQKYVERYKKTRMEKEGLATEIEFRDKMKENLSIDPCEFAKKRLPEEVYFVMALKDKSVPTQYQELLFEAFQRTGFKKKYKMNHAFTLMFSHLMHHKAYSKFLNARIKK